MTALQAAQAQAEKQQQADGAPWRWSERKAEIFNNPADPVIGNAEGDVTVVEFFDYRCPYCKRVSDSLVTLVEGDAKVRVVYKELPILGPESLVAAKIALAAHRQGKYAKCTRPSWPTRARSRRRPCWSWRRRSAPIPTKLAADMEDPAIHGQLQANDSLAAELGITGTPGFLFGKQLVPGAISLDDMKKLVATARAQGRLSRNAR